MGASKFPSVKIAAVAAPIWIISFSRISQPILDRWAFRRFIRKISRSVNSLCPR